MMGSIYGFKTVNIGEDITATTPGYSLDVSATGSPEFDLVCLASTLLQLCGERHNSFCTREKLLQNLSTSREFVDRAVVSLCQASGDINMAITSIIALCQEHQLDVLDAAFPHPK